MIGVDPIVASCALGAQIGGDFQHGGVVGFVGGECVVAVAVESVLQIIGGRVSAGVLLVPVEGGGGVGEGNGVADGDQHGKGGRPWGSGSLSVEGEIMGDVGESSVVALAEFDFGGLGPGGDENAHERGLFGLHRQFQEGIAVVVAQVGVGPASSRAAMETKSG